ncbi:MAG: pyridoxal phosphate-dependent aminotransferase [Chitinophagales bacterium]|nr:pyridoxal phosphate-dependent aminotransferase [Chitinophagales bacterium]
METTTKQLLSDLIINLKESETIKMAAMARQLKSEGKDIISLSLGEPDFDTPEHIKASAKKAIDDNFSHYTPVPGYLELREAIVNKFKRDNDLDYNADQIVVSTGAKQSIANVVLCLVNKGDEIILPAPYWVSYGAIADMTDGKKIEIPTSIENDFKITAEELDAVCNENSKLLIFSSPCNPTGSVYSFEELKSLADVIVKYPSLIVVSDEIYEYINFEGKHESIAQFDHIKDQVVTVNGMSKGFAMTGWRVGYLAAPVWLAKACSKMQGQFTSGTNSIAQRASITALSSDLTPTYNMRDVFLKRRDLMIEKLSEIEGMKVNKPKGAFYIFPDVSDFFGRSFGSTTINNPSDVAEYLLSEAEVAVVSGVAFGDSNCIRISFAAAESELTEAVRRMTIALNKLS